MPKRKPIDEERMKAQRRQTLLILLDQLFKREEATFKAIVDCLYDIGSVNLINNRFHAKPLKRGIKSIARFSKPAFRFYALRRFQKQSPEQIANWLHGKVQFKPHKKKAKPKVPLVPTTIDASTKKLAELETRNLEVKQLRAQVQLLRGMLIGAIAVLGGTTLFLGYHHLSFEMRSTPIETQINVKDEF
ncbi:hypothetical protein IQ249_09655 [Lusitaniella coriacea LEGE 07157]|uniref:Uncharacterized protein n=1 Tax=Lusitaniella coriacea LEGE 07157 TaxID=945747 RepID=A0A8J7DW53_9CYAN|nr:hypothetical protein [Lusitaniella coriacea]MBE9116159.1 hypothetical protein [Lusitaniella coriacea LEGE 07157]